MLQIWTLGIIVNVFLFYSIFDIYFKSPIVPVERRHKLDGNVVQPPYKRVVFFSADGLRAETFIKHPEFRPYMTKLIGNDSCVWGVSDTRVPTESRPGHVALFAGFYEDPSAVFTGWKENTVEFDTVFNQSVHSIGLGSKDIVSIFSRGAAQEKMFTATFPTKWQDFSGEHASDMDNWVKDYFVGMVKNGTVPKGQGVVIFLHLLGIDTIGHAKKPESIEYKNAMKLVDTIVENTQKVVEGYFGDKQTLFVYTADHGMTNWGSHGDGSNHETETPYVIWGPGVIKEESEKVRLRQADFAALLSGVLGIGYPSNSIGRFPTSFWKDKKFAFEALKANFNQLLDLMNTKRKLVESTRNLGIINFKKEASIKEKLQFAEESSRNTRFADAITHMEKGIDLTMEGILYYERYDMQLLIIFAMCTTLSWITFVGSMIILMSSNYKEVKIMKVLSGELSSIAMALLVAFFIIRVLIGWSLWRVPYGFFPVYLVLLISKLVWRRGSCLDPAQIVEGRVPIKAGNNSWINSLFLLLVASAIGVEILANSFDKRGVLSLGLLLNAIWCTQAKKVSSWQKTLFFVAVALLSVFPLMPVIGKERNPLFVTLGPLISAALVSILLFLRRKKSQETHRILWSQIALLLSVSILSHYPNHIFTRIIAWLSLCQSYFLPVFVSAESVSLRLISLFVAIACPFSFICFSYEALFFPSLFLVLLILLKVEMSEENLEDSWTDFLTLSTETRERRKLWEKVDLHEAVRRAWLHLFFVTLSFFGTGNIASVNSFDPSSTRCFVSVFRPWIMMMVLIEKILGPFLLVSCFFRRLLWDNFQVERSFLIVLLLCQGMSLHTFFKVKNVGSWLEIGTSISHHVIVSATTLVLFIFHFIADFIISFEPWSSSSRSRFIMPSHDTGQQDKSD